MKYNLTVILNYPDSDEEYAQTDLDIDELRVAIDVAMQSVTSTSFVFTVVKVK